MCFFGGRIYAYLSDDLGSPSQHGAHSAPYEKPWMQQGRVRCAHRQTLNLVLILRSLPIRFLDADPLKTLPGKPATMAGFIGYQDKVTMLAPRTDQPPGLDTTG